MTLAGHRASKRRHGSSRTVPDRRVIRLGSGGAILLLLLGLFGCGEPGQVEDPVPLYGDVPIEYPIRLWDADVEGETLLRIRITEMGMVDSAEVLETSGYPDFDSAAVRGVLRLQYRPATRDGRRIQVWAKVPIQFTKPGQ